MGYFSAKGEGHQFFKYVPHFRDFTRSSGTFSLNLLVEEIVALEETADAEMKEDDESVKGKTEKRRLRPQI